MHDKPTALSKALGFLVRDFHPDFMWWELLMAWRLQPYVIKAATLCNQGCNPM